MKAFAFILATLCLAVVAAPMLPPMPPVPVRMAAAKLVVGTNAVKRWTPPPPLPTGYGVSYTNEFSLCPTNRMVNGVGRAKQTLLRHSFIHNTNTGSFALWWKGVTGETDVVEWSDNGIFYPLETCPSWEGYLVYSNLWESTVYPTNGPRCWRVVRL